MLVLGWVTAWEYMVLQAFFDLRLFLQTPAKNSIIILEILSFKKIWPRGGDSNRLPLRWETDALSTWPHRHKVWQHFFGQRLFCRHLQRNLSLFLPFSACINVCGHIMLNTQVLVRSLKLSNIEPC